MENTKLKIAMNTSHEELEKIKLQTESRVSQNNKLFSAAAPMEKQDNVVITQLEKENQYLK